MARDSRRRRASESKSDRMAEATAAPPPPPRGDTDRDKAVDALMVLLTEQPFERIGLADVAARAGIKLSALRAEFGSTLAIFAAHIKDIDKAVLDGDDDDMAEEPARERLFDVLMRRLELMAPYKEAVRSMLRSARRNPGLTLALNRMAVRSQTWMLEAAGISATGPRGALRAQGGALMFARVVEAWLEGEDDEDSLDLAMAALNRGLASAERWDGFVSDIISLPRCLIRRRPRRRHARYEDDADFEAA
ncbi:MAG: TetR/AcrR family transcriptional regulator [Rhodopseudomonas sp.]|nr:TetR/AcrR family transcriptional regulator [Rhodopseudomonas sp.]